jgi:3-phenylpropionate/cinnamic acid dioxygenase small subunit
MSATQRYIALNSRDLRLELEELYAAYTACLDEERFEEWPGFFVEHCVYKIVPRENFERGLPLATWLCESRGYLADRVTAIRKTAVYAPRYVRRMVSGIRVLGWKEGMLEVRANYARRAHADLQHRPISRQARRRGGQVKIQGKALHFRQPPRPEQPGLSPLT